MSMGYGGFAKKISEDDVSVSYEYGSFNLNIPKYINKEKISDGLITINKSALLKLKYISEFAADLPVVND